MAKSQVERNAWEVLKLLESWHKIERGTYAPDSPMDRKSREESKPPVGDPALVLMHLNREATKRVEPELTDLRRHDLSFGGISFNALQMEIRQDPGAVRRWRAANDTNQDAKNWLALRAMCRLIAQRLAIKHDADEPYVLTVKTDPRDEEAANNIQAAARDREAARAEQYERGRQMRVKRFREIREEERERYGKCDVSSAMRLWMIDRDMGWDTIRRALDSEPEGEELKREKGRVA